MQEHRERVCVTVVQVKREISAGTHRESVCYSSPGEERDKCRNTQRECVTVVQVKRQISAGTQRESVLQ